MLNASAKTLVSASNQALQTTLKELKQSENPEVNGPQLSERTQPKEDVINASIVFNSS
jgi:hypothetical protein